MKSFVFILLAAALLIGLGLTVAHRDDTPPASDSPAALELCQEGTRDANAFRLRDAVRKLGRALELDPYLAEASIPRALAFARLGERDNLAVELSRADSLTAAIQDDHRRLLAQLRLSAFRDSRFHTMRDSVLDVLEKSDPENIHVLVALTSRAAKSEDPEAYENAWLKIIDVDPNYANSYNMLGYMELNRGNYARAIEYMKKYAFLAPDLANPHDSLGEVLMVMGRYEEAEAEFRQAVTMQPDFYVSLINLGKTYLARGQLERGLDILEKVRVEVAGSDLEKYVDTEIVHTYLVAGLDKELDRVSAIFIERYPEDGFSCVLRGVRLAFMGQVDEARAVMDSSLTAWRQSDKYQASEKVSRSIDAEGYLFEALVADAVGNPEAGAWNWERALDMQSTDAEHDRWYMRYRLASDLLAVGRSEEALAEIDPILAVNPRLINVLILKVKCHLDRREGEAALAALEQLQWSISQSDPDFPARIEAAELETRVSSLAGQ